MPKHTSTFNSGLEPVMNIMQKEPFDRIREKLNKTADGDEISEAEERLNQSPLVADVRAKLEEAERYRIYWENQWIRNLNSYRGYDSSEAQFRRSENSNAYIRTTTVKTRAADAQITEALFSDGRFPISVSETIKPDGVSEYAHLSTDMEEPVQPQDPTSTEPELAGGVGFEGDGFEIEPGSTMDNMKFLGGLEEQFKDKDGQIVMEEGPAKAGEPQVAVAKRIARKMEKKIHDMLDETKAMREIRKVIREMCLYGTGVLKGPFNMEVEIPKWEFDDNGNSTYAPEFKKTARCNMVEIWDIYPDPNASNANEMEWLIERHRMNRYELRNLKNRPHFNPDAIERVVAAGGNYSRRTFESQVEENNSSESEGRLYEVLEFWGYMDMEMLKEYHIDIPEHFNGDSAQVNVWVSGDEVLRVVVNPFLPQRIPYYIVPYEIDPHTIWGTGVPETMEDSQALMNGFLRLAVDNLALAGNLVFDIDESALVAGQPLEIEPGMIFRRQAGSPGQAVNGISFPNTAPANMQMFQQLRQLADESTGIPSFAHGQTGITSPTRTASGMSMLLSNASLNIKTVIRNIDDELLKPLGEAYFRWHMQNDPDPEIKGDLEVKATGSSSLQTKEIRSQRLNNFLQMAGNPALAPLIRISTVLREFAISMDMDPDEILNSPEEQQIYARLMQTQGMQHPAQAPAGPAMGPDGVPQPGEPAFTGNDQGGGGPDLAALAAGGAPNAVPGP